MARLNIVVQNEANVALTGGAVRTLCQFLAAAQQRVAVKGFGIYLDGASTTAVPGDVDLSVQTSAGTGGSAYTPKKRDRSLGETVQTTALVAPTAEPTTTDMLEHRKVHPQQGTTVYFPLDNEIVAAGGTRIGLRANFPANVNARGFLLLEE